MFPGVNPMQRIVLTAVGAIYTLLGIWCTISPMQTAQSLGYSLSSAGLIEYVVVYGGLEVGLGLAMVTGARRPRLLPGVFFMTCVFSLVLPLYRSVLLLIHESNPSILAIFGVELVIAVVLLATAWHTREVASQN